MALQINAHTRRQYTTPLQQAFLRGRMDEFVFEGLYEGGNITVVTLTGRKFTVQVRYTDNVHDIHEKISASGGGPILCQILVFGGRRLKPYRSIYSYNIPVGATLHLLVDSSMWKPWCPVDSAEVVLDQHNIDEAVRTLVEKRRLQQQPTHV